MLFRSYIHNIHLILTCNPDKAPSFDFKEESMCDRVTYCKFTQQFKPNNEVTYLKEDQKFVDGVFTWMAYGAYDYYQQCTLPKVPENFKNEKTRNIEALDSVNQFLKSEDDVTHGDGLEAKSSALYEVYRDFCVSNNYVKETPKTFKEIVNKAGFKWKKKKDGNVYTGLKIAE